MIEAFEFERALAPNNWPEANTAFELLTHVPFPPTALL